MKIDDIKNPAEHNRQTFAADKLAGLRMKMERYINDSDYTLDPIIDMIAREVGDDLASYFGVSVKLTFDHEQYEKDHGEG